MKYFKIVNSNGHNSLIYHEGYNEDPLPWNPSGDCEPGGIYFAREDIFSFIGYGEDLYEVEPVGEIYENPGMPKKYKAHAVNLKYIGRWKDNVRYLIDELGEKFDFEKYFEIVVQYCPERIKFIDWDNEQHVFAIAKYCPDKLDPDKFNWGKYSSIIAEFCPDKLDTEKFNWECHSWAVAKFCPDKLDPDKFNWKQDSWAVAQYCPEKLDPEKFNWKQDSWEVAEYCPDKLDPERFNWEEDSWAVAKFCPEKLALRRRYEE